MLKVVGYYDLSVLSMSVMGFQKKKSLDGGWVGGVSSIQVFFLDFLNFFNFANSRVRIGPGKSCDLIIWIPCLAGRGIGKSWNLMLAYLCAAELPTIPDCPKRMLENTLD